MDPATGHPGLRREIHSLLARLRWRIRAYVWLEGLSLALAWLIAMFWIGLALDYLPVLAGVGEMPRPARAVLLAMVGLVFLWILYRWLIRRLFARLADRSMALLLERRFQNFRDGLITSVELAAAHTPDTDAGRAMLAETERIAVQRIQAVRIADVFNFRPLTFTMAVASLLVASLGAFYVANAEALDRGASRLIWLDDEPWPRRAHIEVMGVERRNAVTGEPSSQLVPFKERVLKTAKGANLGLLVRADAAQTVVPETCTIQYRTAEGERGRVNMTRVGRIRDGYQLYKYDGKPFDGVLSAIQFDVIGSDHRVSGYSIQVVDSPTIVDIQVACRFPDYMVDERISAWLPRTVPYTAGIQLPRGTQIVLHCRANKPLKEVQLLDPDTSHTIDVPLTESAAGVGEFQHSVAALGEHLTLDVSLIDTDDVQSDRPYRIHIGGIEDGPPLIEMRLAGIGTAVTPDVLLPARGKLTDDYGLARSWVEVAVNESAAEEFEFQPAADGAAETSIDFRSERAQPEGLTLQPKDKLHVTVKATDKRALDSGPNLAAGDHYALDVVTSDQLLALLEGRELGLRRRFEQIIEELAETRDMLLRIKTDGPEQAASDEPTGSLDKASASSKPAERGTKERLERVWSMRVLRVRQAFMQSQKAAQEILGVAAAFRDIREELINNRVDTEDRKTRLEEQIAAPLQRVGSGQFPELDRRLEKLGQILAAIEQRQEFEREDPATLAAAQDAIDQASQILNELDTILRQMIDLEDFNELLDIVRSLMDEQQRLMNEVKQEQKKTLLELLK